MVEFLKELGNPHNGVLGGLTVCVMGIIALEWLYKLGKFIYGEAITWYKSKKSKDDKFEAVDAVQEDNEKQDERLDKIEVKLKNNDFEHRIPKLEEQNKELLEKVNNIESCVNEIVNVVTEMKQHTDNMNSSFVELKQDEEYLKQKTSNHEDSIMKIYESLNQINDSLKVGGENTRQYIVVTSRSTIYRMYSECRKTGFITREAYFMITKLIKVYEDAGGNDIVHERIKPFLSSLPIKDYDANGNLVDYIGPTSFDDYKDKSDGDDV